MIDTRAIILRKNFTTESGGGGEDGGHRRYSGSNSGRPREGGGSGRGERSGGKVRGKTMEGDKLDGGHVYFLFRPPLDFGEKYR